jgi:hypothetical protein
VTRQGDDTGEFSEVRAANAGFADSTIRPVKRDRSDVGTSETWGKRNSGIRAAMQASGTDVLNNVGDYCWRTCDEGHRAAAVISLSQCPIWDQKPTEGASQSHCDKQTRADAGTSDHPIATTEHQRNSAPVALG